MPVTINGSGGFTANDGSAAAPSIAGTDSNTGIFFPAADTIAFAEGGAEAMRIDSSGNLGLGVTPNTWSVGRALELGFAGNALWGNSSDEVIVSQNAYFNSGWKYASTRKATHYSQYDAQHRWFTAPSGTAGNAITWTQAMTLDSSGNLLVAKTTTDFGTAGFNYDASVKQLNLTTDGNSSLRVNRLTSDGNLVSFQRGGSEKGTISVSGETVSYNAFAGSHWSQLSDGSKPEILRGTVMESIDELCQWPDEPTTERLCRVKVSDAASSKKVYGVFMCWDEDWIATNDMLVTSVGAFVCRVNGAVVVQEGDLLESNGDGTARVQADDIMRSSTIGKVTCTIKTHEYADGSYCVPAVLYCG